MKPATELIRGEGVSHDAEPLTTPIYETTTFVFENAAEVRAYNEGKSSKFLYSRYANPTVLAVEQKIARLEGAESRAGALERPGSDHDRAAGAAARRRRSRVQRGDLWRDAAPPRRSAREVRDPAAVRVDRGAGPARVHLLGRDEAGVVRVADQSDAPVHRYRRRGERVPGTRVISVLDNTFASPINQQPIALGVDLVMHSATKYLNGHSDVTAGALAGSRAHMARILDARKKLGTVLDPHAAYALGRGLKTLGDADRTAQRQRDGGGALVVERQARGAGCITRASKSIRITRWRRKQMRGFGGMVCVDLGGGYDRAAAFFDRLQIFKRAASLGGVESLCSLPVLTSQWGHSKEELASAGVTDSMARLSVGLEDAEDLIADLDQAL